MADLARARRGTAELDAWADRFFEAHLRGRPAVDLVMYGASALGDHGALWALMAGAEGMLGKGGPSWRPFFRAICNLAVESVLVNGLVKLAFRRRRPEARAQHPLPLRTPVTSSFPSGHASSAFFAAALLRRRRTWPLYYGLAVIVASSRVHVRAHYASDALGGALLGAALGEVARRVSPVLGNDNATAKKPH